MNVYITATTGFSNDSINEVTALLNMVNGEIKFISGEPFTHEQLIFCNPKFSDFTIVNKLSFDELFNIAKFYRIINTKISKDDLVVVISTFSHEKNWFSGTSKNNIFVDANGWEYFTDKDSKYGIAAQVVENIFQTLLGIDYDNARTHPNVHRKSIGCINDMCDHKPDVILKLRTGYICKSCLTEAQKRGVSQMTIFQIHNLMQMIRDSLMNFDFLQQIIKPEPTNVDKKGIIHIGNTKVKFEEVLQTLFIFYLAHLDGVRVDSLNKSNEYKEKLLSIYRQLRKGGNKETIDQLCLPYDDKKSTFQKVKSNTNKGIINLLGKDLSEFYVISNIKGEIHNSYKIKLSPEYLTFELDL